MGSKKPYFKDTDVPMELNKTGLLKQWKHFDYIVFWKTYSFHTMLWYETKYDKNLIDTLLIQSAIGFKASSRAYIAPYLPTIS